MQHLFIVGAGGIGCAVGYALLQIGAPVIFVEADPEKVLWGQGRGVQVDHRPPRVARFELFEDWSPPADAAVILCTKCYDNNTVLARLPPSARLMPMMVSPGCSSA